jgi:hypothetical protein
MPGYGQREVNFAAWPFLNRIHPSKGDSYWHSMNSIFPANKEKEAVSRMDGPDKSSANN